MNKKIKKILKKIRKKIDNFIFRWNKINTIYLFFLLFFAVIIWKMFSYTVLNVDFYKNLADSQQIWKTIVAVNRWTIFSSNSSISDNKSWKKSAILWTSINLYNLAIDPTMTWDKAKLWGYLVNIVYKELCQKKWSKKCKNNLLNFLKVLDIEDFVYDKKYIKTLLWDYITKKLQKTRVTSVFVDREFDAEQIERIEKLNLKWISVKDKYIYINPELFSSFSDEVKNNNIKNLARITWMNELRLKYLTEARDLKYIPILKKISVDTSDEIKSFIKDEKQAYNRLLLKKENSIYWFFILEDNPNRFYPEETLAAQVIWFVDNDWVWHYGIEWYFNNILKWNNGSIISRQDVKWRIINTISWENSTWNEEWIEIITTIDRNIQKKVEEILESGVKEYKANKWTAIVMEPKTWKIVAMANYPTFDLNNFWDVYELEKVRYSKYPNPSVDLLWYPVFVEDTSDWKKFYYDNKEIYLREASLEELWDNTLVKYKYKNWFWAGVYKNDAISSLYEPGSITKAITIAIWIDTWEINQYSKYKDKWFVDVWIFKIWNDDVERCSWYNTFWHALNFSCNVWMIRTFQRVWETLVYQYFNDFWFSKMTWIELEWETFSIIAPWENWAVSNLFTMSYWLWISLTPLQMVSAYSTLVNWWIYIKPKIIEKIIYPNWKEKIFKTEKEKRVIKESSSKLITKMLYDSVEKWFAKSWAVEWYSVWGKTWTAQINYKWEYKSWPGWTNASYVWFWPVEDPKFVIIVKLERPRTNVYWARTSGLIFQKIASYLFNYYGIPKKK